MPLIKVQTSALVPADLPSLLKKLSASLAAHLHKPESYVMTAFEAGVPMTFGGTDEPTCYVEIKSIGTMPPAQTEAMSAEFCQILGQGLGVEPKRIYLEFTAAERAMWGWDGRTFAS